MSKKQKLVIIPRTKWDDNAVQHAGAHQRVDWNRCPVRLHHTAIIFRYKSRTRKGRIAEEAAHMRLLRLVALGRGYSDISYNYVVFPSGRIWIGRGVEVLGAHTLGHNEDPGVCIAGNTDIQRVGTRRVAAISKLVGTHLPKRHGTRRRLIPHSATFSTGCPGRKAMRAFRLSRLRRLL